MHNWVHLYYPAEPTKYVIGDIKLSPQPSDAAHGESVALSIGYIFYAVDIYGQFKLSPTNCLYITGEYDVTNKTGSIQRVAKPPEKEASHARPQGVYEQNIR